MIKTRSKGLQAARIIFLTLFWPIFTVFVILSLYILCDVIVGAVLVSENEKYYESVKAVGSSIAPEEKDGVQTFVTDGKFEVLALADTHIGGGVFSGDEDAFALRAIEKIVTEQKPNLVVLVGDTVYNPILQTANTDNLKSMKIVANLMEKLGVYWAPVFGNHEAEEGAEHTKAELAEYLESEELTYCMFERGDENITGEGNYVINVENTVGVITRSLIFMDTGSYVGNSGDYDNVHKDQINWYAKQINEQKIHNNALGQNPPPSSLFVHIPFEEYETAYEEGEVLRGSRRETICYGKNYGMFKRITELALTDSVFCGHDHTNDFVALYKGVQLSYIGSIDYLAYIYTKFYNPVRGGTRITYNGGQFTSVSVRI